MGCDDFYPPRKSSEDIAYDEVSKLLGRARGAVNGFDMVLKEYRRRGARIRELEQKLVETRALYDDTVAVSPARVEAAMRAVGLDDGDGDVPLWHGPDEHGHWDETWVATSEVAVRLAEKLGGTQ